MHEALKANRRLSTKDFVYFEVKKKIVEGSLAPDQSINEMELAEEMEVSRTPIREAVQRLEIEELVVRLPNGRLKVAPLSVREVEEIFRVRSLLEGLVAREATIRATDEDIEKLRQFTQQFTEASENSRNDEVVMHGSEFHSYLYDISQNRTAIKILSQFKDHIFRYRRLGPTMSKERSRLAAEEHREMFRAIADGDHERAERLMRAHISNSLKAAIHSIEKHFGEDSREKAPA